MRLQKYEIDSIKSATKHIFGTDSNVILFGSRVDDDGKGGDIDLYVQTSDPVDAAKKKIDFLVALKLSLGDQKIDVIISRDPSRLIEQEALKTGIIL